MTIHKEGFRLVLFTLLAVIVINSTVWFLTDSKLIFILVFSATMILFGLITQFFRLPKRRNTSVSNELVAPCDGKVVVIEEVMEGEFFKDKRIQLSIFMSPINVHANWAPCAGDVKYVKYHEGLYLVAWHPKSSTENERTTVVIEGENGKSVLLRQIAGAVARRIMYYVKPGDKIARNQEFGFIKFGSRVDVLLPVGTEIKVKIGDKTTGNETVIAAW